jgi:hypothetical protein
MEWFIRHSAWLGVVLSAASFVSYFTVMAKIPSLRDNAWLNLALCGIGAALAIAGAIRLPRWYRFLASAFAIAVAGFFGWYLYFFSAALPAPSAALELGAELPRFELVNAAGAPIELAPVAGKTLILVFYRGHW